MAKRAPVSIDDVISAIESARDKVMNDEIKSLVKSGLPRNYANKIVAERYHQRPDGEEGEGETAPAWPEIS